MSTLPGIAISQFNATVTEPVSAAINLTPDVTTVANATMNAHIEWETPA